mmetsp:Transcript_104606/g.181728  ORF Transcript_104606/g.181728 Transcript_104606/m.181728 type:complete len:191 (+) Transcript_104606:67-639(+)
MNLDTPCTVLYQQPKNPRAAERSIFKSDNNPHANDRHYMNKLDMARQRAAENYSTRSLTTSSLMSGRSALGWSHGEEEWAEAVDLEQAKPLSRSASAPTNKAFNCKAFGETNRVHRMAPDGRRSIPHLPGYRGFVPGYYAESSGVGRSFSLGTHEALETRRADRMSLTTPSTSPWRMRGVAPWGTRPTTY